MRTSISFILYFGSIAIAAGCSLDQQCKIGDRKCDDSQGVAILRTCPDGFWTEEPCSACNEDKTGCSVTNESSASSLEVTCQNNESNHGKLTFFEINPGDIENKKEKNSNECANGYSCKNDQSCGECTNDDEKCENDKIYKCSNGLWGEGTTCDNESSCKSSTECGECLNGATKCTDGKYKPCVNGVWLDFEIPCDSGKCTNDGTECEQKHECEGNETRCTEIDGKSVLQSCVENQWQNKDCDFGCNAQTGECAYCTEGETKCEEGNGLSTCIGGKWSESSQCTCKDDKTCKECEPDSKQCVDTLSYRECQQDGTWSDNRNCNNGEKCFQGECQRACTEGIIQCVNNHLYQCISNKWEDKNCEFGCETGTSNNNLPPGIQASIPFIECNECENGTTECNDNKMKTCQNGKWQESECSFGCLDTLSCAKCDEKENSCTNDNNGTGQVTTCTPAIGLTTKQCNNVSCSGNECGKCKNGDTRCENDNKGIGHIQTCKEGKWIETQTCEAVSCNADNTSCGLCINGSSSCYDFFGSENTIKVKDTCTNGLPVSKTYCNYGETCSNCTPYFVHSRKINMDITTPLSVLTSPNPDSNLIGNLSPDKSVMVYARNGNYFLTTHNNQAGWFYGGYNENDHIYNSIYSAPSKSNLKDNPSICADFLGVLGEVKEMWSYNDGDPKITKYCKYGNSCENCTIFTPYHYSNMDKPIYSSYNSSHILGMLTENAINIYGEYISPNSTHYLLIEYKSNPGWVDKESSE